MHWPHSRLPVSVGTSSAAQAATVPVPLAMTENWFSGWLLHPEAPSGIGPHACPSKNQVGSKRNVDCVTLA